MVQLSVRDSKIVTVPTKFEQEFISSIGGSKFVIQKSIPTGDPERLTFVVLGLPRGTTGLSLETGAPVTAPSPEEPTVIQTPYGGMSVMPGEEPKPPAPEPFGQEAVNPFAQVPGAPAPSPQEEVILTPTGWVSIPRGLQTPAESAQSAEAIRRREAVAMQQPRVDIAVAERGFERASPTEQAALTMRTAFGIEGFELGGRTREALGFGDIFSEGQKEIILSSVPEGLPRPRILEPGRTPKDVVVGKLAKEIAISRGGEPVLTTAFRGIGEFLESPVFAFESGLLSLPGLRVKPSFTVKELVGVKTAKRFRGFAEGVPAGDPQLKLTFLKGEEGSIFRTFSPQDVLAGRRALLLKKTPLKRAGPARYGSILDEIIEPVIQERTVFGKMPEVFGDVIETRGTPVFRQAAAKKGDVFAVEKRFEEWLVPFKQPDIGKGLITKFGGKSTKQPFILKKPSPISAAATARAEQFGRGPPIPPPPVPAGLRGLGATAQKAKPLEVFRPVLDVERQLTIPKSVAFPAVTKGPPTRFEGIQSPFTRKKLREDLEFEFLPVPGQRTSPVIDVKPVGRQRLGFAAALTPGVGVGLLAGLKPSLDVRTGFGVSTRFKTGFDFEQSFKSTQITEAGRMFDRTAPERPGIPRLGFDLPFLQKKAKKKKQRALPKQLSNIASAYTPSLLAVGFGITRPKKPKIVTGFGIRPIVTRRRSKKRGKR